VDLSGLIFVALALVWGVVLIPKALRAHDDAARTRSVDASSDRARVLPRSATAVPVETPLQAEPPLAGPLDVQAAAARQRRTAAAAARRRRRVLGILLVATAATATASVAGVLAPWAAAVPGGLVVAFLALARLLVRRERSAWEATLRRLRGQESADRQRAEETTEQPEVTPEPELLVVARNDQGVAVVSDHEDTSSLDAATLARAVGAPSSTLWDPLPVTLPTYVTKPRASRSVRTIDLGSPGVSSSGHDAADSALVADAGGPGEQEPPAQRAVGS
jgi:hypothetical protein